ncbi:MAG: hypothetical protein JSR98_03900 [Proteobacteria bacterium]|nr:hypothetical protein [Pseudomonadota bacterium]
MDKNQAMDHCGHCSAQADLSAEIQAALALSRATLQAIAAFSDAVQTAAEMALEDEADRATPAARGIVEDARDRLIRAPIEARMSRALRQALITAAAAADLPERNAA